MHACRLGKTDRPTDSPLDPRAHIAVGTLDLLCIGLPYFVLLGIERPLRGPPAIRAIARAAQRFPQRLACQKDGVLASSAYLGQPRARVVLTRVPSPARIGFAVHVAPQLVEFSAEPTPHLQHIRTPYLDLHVLGGQVRHHRLIHWRACRFLFVSSCMPGVGLTCSTRAVSRMPLACRAISTMCCLMAGDWLASAYSRRNVRPRPARHCRQRSRCVPAGDLPWRTISVSSH